MPIRRLSVNGESIVNSGLMYFGTGKEAYIDVKIANFDIEFQSLALFHMSISAIFSLL